MDILRAPQGAVLTSRKSWTVLPAAPTFSELVPANTFDYFGVPFYRSSASHGGADQGGHRLGWGDAHLLHIGDPQHVWSDSDGHTFHLLARAAFYRGNLAVWAKVTQDAGGDLTTEPETTPAGNRLIFLPFPGGNLRFHVMFDEVSGLYWLLSCQITDSMRRPERGKEKGRGLPCDERHRLQLHFSRNLVDWCFAGFVDAGDDRNDARNDTQMAIRGDDLCVVTCTGETVTCGVIPAFRELIY